MANLGPSWAGYIPRGASGTQIPRAKGRIYISGGVTQMGFDSIIFHSILCVLWRMCTVPPPTVPPYSTSRVRTYGGGTAEVRRRYAGVRGPEVRRRYAGGTPEVRGRYAGGTREVRGRYGWGLGRRYGGGTAEVLCTFCKEHTRWNEI